MMGLMDEKTEDRAHRVFAVREAAVALVESHLVMGAVGGSEFNHLFHRPGGWPRDNSLCESVAATPTRRRKYPVAKLYQVDCLGCLDALAEQTRPHQ